MIGTIVPYAGDCGDAGVTGALARLGWLPCDGAILPIGRYPELYQVIGLNFGGEYDQGRPVRFNLPDLSGQLVRGVNLTAVNPDGRPVDPDVSGRAASHANGKAGNQVGSRQAPATGAPVTPFTAALDGRHRHLVRNITNRSRGTSTGVWDQIRTTGTPGEVSSDGAHTHQVQGGDAETRPVNVSLFFIIKASLGATAWTATVPIGSLITFGGAIEGQWLSDLRDQGWLLCDGAPYPARWEYQALSVRIGTSYGGGGGRFNVPDFRGRFARGADHGRGQDPDASARVALSPGGNTGDRVGSAQPCATGLPVSPFRAEDSPGHRHQVPNWTNSDHVTMPGSVECMQWPADSTQTSEEVDHSHLLGGYNAETRPGNVYAHYFIKFRHIEAADPDPQAIPVGMVLPFAGDAADPAVAGQLRLEGWLPCFGQVLKAAGYQGLFDVVRYSFGGTGNGFSLPDLRGQFVRGARASARPGPGETIGTSQGYATMLPRRPDGTGALEATSDGGHRHELFPDRAVYEAAMAVHGSWRTASRSLSAGMADPNGSHQHALSGGDRESRPVNIYVDYIIKFAEPAS